jgi:3-hydroxy-9,10-secoandrosta-1,3,5(10)-triene-9,17-dione monooxygenase reductase component
MAIDGRDLRNAMGLFATGVTIITTKDASGKPFGLTANAFSSLSLDPPMLLICVDKGVDCYACFDESKVFAVNFLSLAQEELSTRFATKGIEKFEGLSYSVGELGVALLDGALAHFECTVAHAHEGGDHTIYLGEVQRVVTVEGDPLLFYQGKYRSLAPQ